MTRHELKILRQKPEWTQKRLGQYPGISDKSVSHYETGYRRILFYGTVLADALRHRLHQKNANLSRKRRMEREKNHNDGK